MSSSLLIMLYLGIFGNLPMLMEVVIEVEKVKKELEHVASAD